MNNNAIVNNVAEMTEEQAVPFLPDDDLPIFQKERVAKEELDGTVKVGDLHLIKQELYLELDIMNTFQATGQGWQLRLNQALRQAIVQGLI